MANIVTWGRIILAFRTMSNRTRISYLTKERLVRRLAEIIGHHLRTYHVST